MTLKAVIDQALRTVDAEIARLTEIRATLVSLDHDKPARKHRHFSAATRRKMSIAQRKRWKKGLR